MEVPFPWFTHWSIGESHHGAFSPIAVDQSNAWYHLGAACVGGGQGIAVLLERA